MLDVRRGDGTYVTSLTPELLLDAMSFVVDIHQDSSALELTLTEHHVDALGKSDVALAAAQMTVHIDGVARWLRRATGS